jgi:Flagellar hook-length control protein FliK
MTAAGTVTATSTEGAGDMPSVSAASAVTPDDAPPFSEVLSLSSPDGVGDLPSSLPPARRPSGSPRGDGGDAHEGKSGSLAPSSGTERPSGGKGHRRPGSSGVTERPAANGAGSTDPSEPRSRETGQVPPPDTTHTEDGGPAVDLTQDFGAAPGTISLPSLTTTASPQRPSAVVAAAVPDGPTQPGIAVGAQGGSDGSTSAVADVPAGSAPSALPAPTATSPEDADAGSSQGSSPSDIARFGRIPAVLIRTEARTTETRVPLEQGVPHAEPLLRVVGGSVPADTASALSADRAETLEFAAAPAGEASELTEFPAGGIGTEVPGLDTGNLAASISRPLADGNGDYSVQVSLHPPELGEVRALMSLQGDVLHVTLTPEHASGFEALSAAMPGLHQQLSGGGVEVHVTLGHPGDTHDPDGQGAADAWPGGRAQSEGVKAAAPASSLAITSDGSGRIHLVL